MRWHLPSWVRVGRRLDLAGRLSSLRCWASVLVLAAVAVAAEEMQVVMGRERMALMTILALKLEPLGVPPRRIFLVLVLAQS
jgi:hypothetical protein